MWYVLIKNSTKFYYAVHFVTVLYAPLTCELGLDTAKKCDRDAVWLREKSLPAPVMNLRSVFYPQTCGYVVCSISDGIHVHLLNLVHTCTCMYNCCKQ